MVHPWGAQHLMIKAYLRSPSALLHHFEDSSAITTICQDRDNITVENFYFVVHWEFTIPYNCTYFYKESVSMPILFLISLSHLPSNGILLPILFKAFGLFYFFTMHGNFAIRYYFLFADHQTFCFLEVNIEAFLFALVYHDV